MCYTREVNCKDCYSLFEALPFLFLWKGKLYLKRRFFILFKRKDECVLQFWKVKQTSMLEIAAPIAGEIVPLSEVDDEVFAHKMMGEGFAIQPAVNTDTIVAPVNGQIIALPPSKHAVGIKVSKFNLEILLHIGLNTVALKGEGFNALVQVNDYVTQGFPLIRFDPKLMEQHHLDMTTMLILTKGYDQQLHLGKLAHSLVKRGQILLRTE